MVQSRLKLRYCPEMSKAIEEVPGRGNKTALTEFVPSNGDRYASRLNNRTLLFSCPSVSQALCIQWDDCMRADP